MKIYQEQVLRHLNKLHEMLQKSKTKIEQITKQIDVKYSNPYFEELWYLRATFFSSILSFFLLSSIDQTLEIYRVYALNVSDHLVFFRIVISFVFIFLLSFLTWYSGRKLSIKRCIDKHDLKAEYKNSSKRKSIQFWTKIFEIKGNFCIGIKYLLSDNEEPPYSQVIQQENDIQAKALHSRAEALRWLPRIFGFLPLLALAFGLFRSINITGFWGSFLTLLFLPAFILVFVALSYRPVLFRFMFSATLTFGLAVGLIFLKISNENFYLFYLCLGIIIVVLLSTFYFDVVNNRESNTADPSPAGSEVFNKKTPTKGIQRIKSFTNEKLRDDNQLFGEAFLILLISLSIVTFSVFTFPLVTDQPIVRLFAVSCISFILFFLFLKLKKWAKYYLFSLILFLILTAFVFPPLASYLGSVSIIALFLSVFVSWSSAIFYYEYVSRTPLIAVLLILAIVASSFNWNDNHRLREISQKTDYEIKSLEESFEVWKNSKLRLEEISKADEDHPYPIYVISAQGGGIFAAYHAALTLSRLQDFSPSFASHIFAISGVSGGSLGAAVFSSLVKTQPPSQATINNQLENKAHNILSQDFLSPLLSAGLFPDFLQRFFPFPIYPVDRARGLEYAFEQAWDKKQLDNPLRDSYYKHWNPEAEAPALVLNTTVVETGEPLLISPFTFVSVSKKFPVLADIATVACSDASASEKYLNFPLSTAAVLSARFPFVTPVGWLEICKDKNGNRYKDKNENLIKSKSRLADGGYFENSGFSTAYQIGQRINEFKDIKKDKRFKVVYLAITDSSFSRPDGGGLNELLSPIVAFYNSGNARGRSAVERAEYEIDRIENRKNKNLSEHEFRQLYLTHAYDRDRFKNVSLMPCKLGSASTECDQLVTNKSNFNLPLGWYLSGFSQKYITDRIGNPKACTTKHESEPAYNNHCVLKTILDELS